MQYTLFTNKAGQVHKMWVEKDGDSFVAYKKDDIYKKIDPDSEDIQPPKEYKMWTNRKFLSREEVENMIEKYVDIGMKAGVFVSKEVKE